MIKEIEKLNKEIEKLMTEKTKADAQKEVWENRLKESINAYNKEYGVDLSGNDLSEIKKNLASEIGLVESETKKEFERSQKIVNYINKGDIKGAWEFLGVKSEDTNITKEDIPQEKVQDKKVENKPNQVEVNNETIEDDDFYGEDSKEDEKVNTNSDINKKSFVPFVVEEDDEDDEFIIPTSENKSSNEGDFSMEDDNDDFGGFGSILAGSKFKI